MALSLFRSSTGSPEVFFGYQSVNSLFAALVSPESSMIVTLTTSRMPKQVCTWRLSLTWVTKAITSTSCPGEHCNKVLRFSCGVACPGIFTVLCSTGWKLDALMLIRTLCEQAKYFLSFLPKDILFTLHTIPFLNLSAAALHFLVAAGSLPFSPKLAQAILFAVFRNKEAFKLHALTLAFAFAE